MTQIIFCSSPINPNNPYEIYERETQAVDDLGKEVGLIDFEALVDECDSAKAIRRIIKSNTDQTSVYRGWMMTPANYGKLYNSLITKGQKLINSPAQYKHCHYLPQWIDLFPGLTPDSAWIEEDKLDGSMDLIMSKIQSLECLSCIVKDYVKSEKHKWKEACFIPDTSDRKHIEQVVNRFRQLRGNNLEGGLVFRKFEQFKSLVSHSKSNMPLTKEYRLFVLDGKIIYWVNYWEEGNYNEEEPPVAFFAELATRAKSRFFSMDIAQTTDGKWLVVELGDGQVTGIPDNADAKLFYSSLFAQLDMAR